MSRRSTWRPLVAAIVAAGVSPASAAATPHNVELVVVPKRGDVVLSGAGHAVPVDRSGHAHARVSNVAAFLSDLRVSGRSHLPAGVSARITRVKRWGGPDRYAVMLEMTYAVQLSFLDLTGRTVASRDVDHVILRSSAGGRVDLPGGATAHLAGMRVVSLTGRLEPKPISWTVDSIWVAGANVVHRSQVRFRPNATRSLPVQLLFFSADVSGHDALFGFHVGHAALITGPNGKTRRYNFGKGSHVRLARLPRGTYTVRIVGPGWSFERPVALSRNQDVDLEVLTWLDVAFAALVFGGGAVALVLIGRPHLRRRVSPRRHGRLHLVASERADD